MKQEVLTPFFDILTKADWGYCKLMPKKKIGAYWLFSSMGYESMSIDWIDFE